MKIVKILNCKHSLILGLLFVVTFFPILMIIQNAHSELSIIQNENNSSVFENLNETTTNTTTTNAILNNLDNKTVLIQEDILQSTQMGNPDVGNNNSSISFDNSTQNKQSGQSHPEVVATQENVTVQIKNSDLQSPIVSYIENEGSQLTPLNYENNNRGFNSNDDDNSESRDSETSSNDDDIKEIFESNSNYNDYLVMLKKMKEDVVLNKEGESRINEEIQKDNLEIETETNEDNKEAETIEEVEEDNKEAETNDNILNDNYKIVKSIPSQKENENKIKGAPVDNENKKLLSQFNQGNSSSVIPDLQIQSEKSIPKDSKLVANAGLDQILKNETRIVLDASSSFSSNGNITNILWKQLGETEEKISPSNSMIYSFPIPDEVEENPLEFELTVMDKNGQKASDTIKILLTDENYLENNDNDIEEQFKEQPAQIQTVDEEENGGNDNDEEEDEDEEDDEDDE